MITTLIAISIPSFSQETKKDSAVYKIKIEELTIKKKKLEKQIAIEDKKRNANTPGVTAETQELLNDRQDSICLGLRSQLVDIELELKELVPDKTAGVIVEHFNSMNKKQKTKATQNKKK